jgi:hypothetical protein
MQESAVRPHESSCKYLYFMSSEGLINRSVRLMHKVIMDLARIWRLLHYVNVVHHLMDGTSRVPDQPGTVGTVLLLPR